MQEIKLAAKSAAAKSAAKKLVRVQAKLIFIINTITVYNSPGVTYCQHEEQYVAKDACVNLVKKTSKILEQSEWQNSATQSIIDHKETFVAFGKEGATLTIIAGNNYHDGELIGKEKTYKVINGVWVCTKV